MVDVTDRTDETDGVKRRDVLAATAGGLAAGGLGISQVGTVVAESGETVTILHDSHFHGRFGDPDDGSEMDIARYQTLIDERRSARENAVFVGNGDDLGPSIMGLVHEGEHVIEALDYLDPLAVGVGNHEFDFGIDTATERFEASDFPWVVANLLTPDDDPIPGTQRWITRDVGGITLGVFGSGVGSFHDITDYPERHRVLDPVEASREATTHLRDAGADVVVLASHTNHDTHYDIAEAVDGLDAIVGSHSGITTEEPEVHSGTVISEIGDEFAHLGELTLDAGGNLVEWQRHDPDPAALDPDSGMAEIVLKWQDKLEEELGQVYFTTDVELDARFATNYARESALGNLICGLMAEYVEGHVSEVDEVDAALQNAGGIRSNAVYGPGGITGLEWLDVLPFPNTIVAMDVAGSTLRDLLRSQVSALPDSSYGAQPAALDRRAARSGRHLHVRDEQLRRRVRRTLRRRGDPRVRRDAGTRHARPARREGRGVAPRREPHPPSRQRGRGEPGRRPGRRRRTDRHRREARPSGGRQRRPGRLPGGDPDRDGVRGDRSQRERRRRRRAVRRPPGRRGGSAPPRVRGVRPGRGGLRIHRRRRRVAGPPRGRRVGPLRPQGTSRSGRRRGPRKGQSGVVASASALDLVGQVL
ncbi:hypothetical protein BRC94_13380 [Halobacteriales archaeon QS_5_70_17]|nr:MAG: hypothetical protein BRC94_13380 [Halobacteriales archaeon QS_5_70_17]